MCIECYVDKNRITPLLNPLECLRNHTQYICGTCGRCICIEHEPKRGLQRWNFPFRSAEIAKMYLRTADYSMKHPCGIYELKNKNGKLTYKIFASADDLKSYLRKNKNKPSERFLNDAPPEIRGAYYSRECDIKRHHERKTYSKEYDPGI